LPLDHELDDVIFDKSTLEDYLTTENGVKWGRDHETITFTLDGTRKRTVNAAQFLNTWDDIIRAIPA